MGDMRDIGKANQRAPIGLIPQRSAMTIFVTLWSAKCYIQLLGPLKFPQVDARCPVRILISDKTSPHSSR